MDKNSKTNSDFQEDSNWNQTQIACSQDYLSYKKEDFETWLTLYNMQNDIIYENSCVEYQSGLNFLRSDLNKIVDIKKLSIKLKDICGWSLLGVAGLLSNDLFFKLLNEKVFPITVHVRLPEEIEFSRLPDIFHDVFGHVPLLTNKSFSDFIQRYGEISIKYLDNEEALTYLGRLYWFTLETGLIKTENGFKPYGGAILSSYSEIFNLKSQQVQIHSFDIGKVMRTDYENLKLQKEYFVIDSFEELFNCISEIENELTQLLIKKPYKNERNN
ncbi:phenylalanine-4-hydroxylase [Chryseobacterium sp. 52]|uniref:phenylalanine-4-hydroxylase n=1 Tax=Chryseobacterium sp. 52 TaxID=2035213 RepID=UPI000C19A98D|nr:phenylalanine-4-hydroxylase [Chryseobacterium sp. 52]PIF44701.1 phenylalanine-4-hydroxylase [Chryseobacterium sp. 52]